MKQSLKLVIGGYAQGKLQAVLRNCPGNYVVFDGVLPDAKAFAQIEPNCCIILNHFHLWVRDELMQMRNPEEVLSFLRQDRKWIIICDEIGNGIVPMDAFEREYRERTGRLLTELASRADEVGRVLCGIEQRIK